MAISANVRKDRHYVLVHAIVLVIVHVAASDRKVIWSGKTLSIYT